MSWMRVQEFEPIMFEEWQELYDKQLAGAFDAATGGGAIGWLVFVAAVIGLVVMMLLFLWGRSRRAEASEATTAPLFEETFEDDAFSRHDGRQDDLAASGFAKVLGDDDAYEDTLTSPFTNGVSAYAEDHADQDVDLETSDGEITDGFSVEQIDDDAAQAPIDESASEASEALFAAAPDEEPEAPDTDETEPARYAFATGRASVSNNSTFDRPDDAEEETDHSSFANSPASSEPTAAEASTSGAPYIAPFIREDIQYAEERQAQRIDTLRDELSREVQTLKSEQASRLDLVIAAIDRKLESLDRRQSDLIKDAAVPSADVSSNVNVLGQQVEQISSAIDGQGQRMRAMTSILENRFAEVSQVYEEVKTVHSEVKSVRGDVGKASAAVGDVRGELDEVKEHVGRLERAILDRAAQDSSTTVRLTDVIRGTLPEESYEFGATLANGESADCLIAFDGLREKIAIDAGFPMEAFHELPSRDAVRRNLPQAKTAEDGFRRAILRSILEAADRCISPAETADSCLLFLPSEAAYTILHDRFPDLVRDSQRARVWLVSPSTLMGTLNLIRNLMPDASDLEERSQSAHELAARRSEDARLREEVEALRTRASSLSQELDRTRGTLRDLIGASERPDPLGSGAATTSSMAYSMPNGGGATSLAEEIAAGPKDGDVLAAEEVGSSDDGGIIDGLRFDGTPEWSSDKDRSDPLR